MFKLNSPFPLILYHIRSHSSSVMEEEDAMDVGDSMETGSVLTVTPPPTHSAPTSSLLQSPGATFQHTSSPGGAQNLEPSTPPAPTTTTMTTCEELANSCYLSSISQQVSMAEYNRQSHYVTQQALRDLKASPEYKQHTMRCHR